MPKLEYILLVFPILRGSGFVTRSFRFLVSSCFTCMGNIRNWLQTSSREKRFIYKLRKGDFKTALQEILDSGQET